MIEFVVIFLVVLSCTGGLFIVLLLLPKVWMKVRAFLLGCSSRLRAFFADWLASTKEQEAELERERRCKERLERERRRREQKHLLWRWDFVGLLASVCGLLFGLFLTFFIGLSAQRDLKLKLDYYGLPITYGPEVIVSMEQWELAFYQFGEMAQIGEGIVFLFLPGVLVFGALFLSALFLGGGSFSAHFGSGGVVGGRSSAAAGGRAG